MPKEKKVKKRITRVEADGLLDESKGFLWSPNEIERVPEPGVIVRIVWVESHRLLKLANRPLMLFLEQIDIAQ